MVPLASREYGLLKGAHLIPHEKKASGFAEPPNFDNREQGCFFWYELVCIPSRGSFEQSKTHRAH